MLWLWLLLPVLLLACDLHLPGSDGDGWLDDLNELAVATFVTERSDGVLPTGRLYFRAGNIYGTDPVPGPGGEWVWQVRYPRVDAIRVPVTARDRQAGVDLAADATIRFEHRFCTLADGLDSGLRCGPWQATSCCNAVWKRSRGAWLAGRP